MTHVKIVFVLGEERCMQIEGYTPIQFVSGPFAGLLGKTLSPVGGGDTKWYVEVNIAGRPVVQEVEITDFSPLR